MVYNCYKKNTLVISIECNKVVEGDDCFTFITAENTLTKLSKTIIKKIESTIITLK